MGKETIAAIIRDRTMINEEGLVQNAEEVAQAIIDALGPPAAVSADIGAEIEAAPSQVAGVNSNYPTPLLTDEDLEEDEDRDEDLHRQQKAEFDIINDLIWRLSEKRKEQPQLHRLSEASFIVETVLQNPTDQLLDAKQYWRTLRRNSQANWEKPGNWLQKYVSDLIARRHCFEASCTTCGGALWFRLELSARIAEIVGPAGSGKWLNADGAKLLVDLMREWKPPEGPSSWRWESRWEHAMQLMISDCCGILGKPIVQDRLGQSWAGLVAKRMIADEEGRKADIASRVRSEN